MEQDKPQPSERAAPFAEMARRIDHNIENGFGGAFVIVPPGDDVQPAVMLTLDNAQDAGVFFGTLKTIIQMAIDDLQAKQDRMMGGFGRM